MGFRTFVFMNVTASVTDMVMRMPEGAPFKYEQLPVAAEQFGAAAKAMSRLVQKGVVSRASTGLFYRPIQSVFGTLRPPQEALLNTFLFKNGQRVAYVTGNALYNSMGLTTQVPKLVKVACLDRRIKTTLINLVVRPVKSYVPVTDDNVALLELLDILKDFNVIPDTDNKQKVRFMLGQLKALSTNRQEQLCDIALKYPPRVRALLGALLYELNPEQPVMKLKESLNPLSIYKYGIEKELLRSVNFWKLE